MFLVWCNKEVNLDCVICLKVFCFFYIVWNYCYFCVNIFCICIFFYDVSFYCCFFYFNSFWWYFCDFFFSFICVYIYFFVVDSCCYNVMLYFILYYCEISFLGLKIDDLCCDYIFEDVLLIKNDILWSLYIVFWRNI